jgi:drug/metabolite transporter (DMT)-like permease
VRILTGSGGGSNEQRETANAFDLPLGREIVFCVGAGFAVAAARNVYRGVSRKFMDDTRTSKSWVCWLGVGGHVARGVVWAIIAWFLIKAA